MKLPEAVGAYNLWPAPPAVLISRARSIPVRNPSFGPKSQPIFSVALLTSRNVYVSKAVEIESLSAKTDRTVVSEAMICDHTLTLISYIVSYGWVSAYA